MAKSIGIRMTGTKETERALKKLASNVRRKVLVDALTKTARQGVSTAKAMLKPSRTGMLKKAMAFKAKSKGPDAVYRVIGADRRLKTKVGGWFGSASSKGASVTLSGRTKGGKVRTRKMSKKAMSATSGLSIAPANYAHLVEGGRKANFASGRTKAATYGPGGTQGPGTMAGNAKAMYFRTFGKGGKVAKVFTKKVKPVRPQPFMKPTSEKLKLVYPYIAAQALKKVWP